MSRSLDPTLVFGAAREEATSILTGVCSKADQVTSPTIPSSTSPFFSEIVLQPVLSLNQISHQFDWADILKLAEVSEH